MVYSLERKKMSLFADDSITYIGNPKESTNNTSTIQLHQKHRDMFKKIHARILCSHLQNIDKSNQTRHKYMERYTVFMDWKAQY